MNTYCTFYIVRHARSEANNADIIAGHFETKLSKEGIEQAQNRAQELKTVHFDAAFASSLERANHTAKIIAQEHSLSVTTLDVLKERHYGAIDGHRYDDLDNNLRGQFDRYNAMKYEERFSAKIVPGMESDEEVINRFMDFLKKTALEYFGKTILVVCHGNMMRTLLVHLGFGTNQELSHGTVKNTAYFVLKSDGVDFEVIKTVGIEKKQA